MTVPEAIGRVVGVTLGAAVMMVARPLVWLIHRQPVDTSVWEDD